MTAPTAAVVPWPLVDTGLVPDDSPEAEAVGNLSTLTVEEHVDALRSMPALIAGWYAETRRDPRPRRLARALPRRLAHRFTVAESDDVARMRRIIARMRSAGLTVEVVEGWETRGRPGLFHPHVVCEHHDASPLSTGLRGYLASIVKGRADLPGPLAQFQVSRDGVWFVVAAGRANHAGVGGPMLGIPANSANAYAYGVEVANNGRSEPYLPALDESLDIGFACILLEIGKPAGNLAGHKEWTPRKTDPVHSMASRRHRVAQRMVPVPPTEPTGNRTPAGDRWLVLTRPYMTGQDVVNVQGALVAARLLTPQDKDGVYGPKTERALNEFKRTCKVVETGCGPLAWAALRLLAHGHKPPAPPVKPPPAPKPPAPKPPVIPAGFRFTRTLRLDRPYLRGDDVKQVQRVLRRLNVLHSDRDVDGVYGPGTHEGVRVFQSSRALHPIDGVVGPQTGAALKAVPQR